MSRRRYAQGTAVGVAKSRSEIEALLRRWGCDGIRWTDHFSRGQVALEFLWTREGQESNQEYLARFAVDLPTDEELRLEARHGGNGVFLRTKYERLCEERGRQEHRLLFLWIKAALEAVDAGIIAAEVLFLPFLVGADGRTVAEIAVPRLPELLSSSASALLALPSRAEG